MRPYQYARDGAVFGKYRYATALEIFAAAATYWLARDKMFIALLDAKTRGSRKVKPLLA